MSQHKSPSLFAFRSLPVLFPVTFTGTIADGA